MGDRAPYLRSVEGHPPERPTDEELLVAVGRGDSAALGELYDRHHRSVFRFLGRLSGCDQRDLDDLVQNTFVAVLESARRFTGRSAVRTWILGIAHNVARNHVRGERRRKQALKGLTDLPRSGGRQADAEADRRRQLAALARAVDALPFDLRAAFLLCGVEGISGEEAERELGVPRGTIWRRLHEARAILAHEIGRRHA